MINLKRNPDDSRRCARGTFKHPRKSGLDLYAVATPSPRIDEPFAELMTHRISESKEC